MKLRIGLIEFDEDTQPLVRRLMQIEPYTRIFKEVEYLRDPLVQDSKLYDGEKTTISVHGTLAANSKYIPENGRLLILTSYVLWGRQSAVGLMGSATPTCFTDKNDGVIVSNYVWDPTNYLEKVEKVLKSGEKDFHKIATLRVEKLSTNTVISSMAHELGHSFHLDHDVAECLMRNGRHEILQFCNDCETKLEDFIQ